MGSIPTKYQAQQLIDHYEDLCKAAAICIHDSDILLLCTGAGFSADSGLPVFADIAKIPAYAERNLEYGDLCTSVCLDNDPETFYGFWGQCFNDYRKTQPHDGYKIVAKWRNEKNRPKKPKKKQKGKSCRSRYKGDCAKRIESRIASTASSDSGDDEVGPYRVHGIAGAFYVFTSNVDAHSFDFFQVSTIHSIRTIFHPNSAHHTLEPTNQPTLTGS